MSDYDDGYAAGYAAGTEAGAAAEGDTAVTTIRNGQAYTSPGVQGGFDPVELYEDGRHQEGNNVVETLNNGGWYMSYSNGSYDPRDPNTPGGQYIWQSGYDVGRSEGHDWGYDEARDQVSQKAHAILSGSTVLDTSGLATLPPQQSVLSGPLLWGDGWDPVQGLWSPPPAEAVLSSVSYGVDGQLQGTLDLQAATSSAAADQREADMAEVAGKAAWILSSTTILGVAGTAPAGGHTGAAPLAAPLGSSGLF